MSSVRKLGCYALREYFTNPDDENDLDEAEHNDPWSLISQKQDTLAFRCSNITHLDLAEVNAGNGMQEWIMASHKGTLGPLWAEPDSGCKFDIDSEWVGNFNDYLALKTICLPFPNLVGLNEQNMPIRRLVDVLPCSLKTIYLTLNDGSNFMEAIMQLMELADCDDFPEMTALHLECSGVSSTYEMTKLEWLQQRCEAANKSFSVHFSKGWFYGLQKPTG
ncbi:hypothetical protein N7450_002292 [Penicillium hetheringtonii]|uniref:Uncharacterized protein n=1 Tax=Penicillium hetheringtonii TaxID=911720 RepID=A0AAD6DX28_9EURO|nr:hypothetical protein N7450_002292 [Penicillium hetheringtonii]